MTEHLFVPDTQVKEGVPIEHIVAAGRLAVARKPDVIVIGGDWWDMESLGTHNDRGNIYYHNKAYTKDLQSGIKAMELFLKPIEEYNEKAKINHKQRYKPRLVFLQGNHEYRRERLEEQQPMLAGAIPTPEDYLWDKGFEVYPYKQAVVIDGISYCHNCPQTKSAGCVERAHLILNRRHTSWTVGHSQILDYFVSPHFPRHQCIIAGAFYLHDEEYKKGSNDHWRGLVYKRYVSDGTYDPEFMSIHSVIEEFGNGKEVIA